MSAVVKLSTKLPGDPEINGLDAMRAQLVAEPEDLVVAVVYFDVSKVTINTDDGLEVPTVRARRVEPLGNIADVPQAVRDAVAAAESDRTGRSPLPFEIVTLGEHAHSDTLDGE